VTLERAPLKPAQQAPAPLPLLTAALAAGWQANANAAPSGNGDSGESGTRRQEDGRPIAAVGNAAQAFDLGATVASQLAPPTAPASVDGPTPAPPLPPAAAPLAAEMPEDPGLSLAVLQKAAHLSIESDNGRSLELHVRLLPEGADIRAAGELAPMMQAKANELGLALAAQGVTLGRFELGDGGGGRDPRDDKEAREDESDRPVVRRRASGGGSTAAPTRIADGRISVKA
jgi:hypothetical protein